MSSNTDWIEEARKRADSKHSAKQLRFIAVDDDDPKDPDIVLAPVGSKVEGVVTDLSEIDGQFGPTTLATIEGTEYGTVKVLAGPKILADLFALVQVGDFVSLVWNGKRLTKDGSTTYRHWSVSHMTAPGNDEPAQRPSKPPTPDPVMEQDDDEDDDPL